MTDEVYFSADVEADGPIPAANSMLSFAAAALDGEKRLLGTFSRNLLEVPGASPDPDTMRFWSQNPEAWHACRTDLVEPSVAMPEFVAWVKTIAGRARPLFVAYPSPYDFKWVDWYCARFAGANPFGHDGCVDAKSFAWSLLGGRFSRLGKSMFPDEWFDAIPHTHVALDDAVGQGAMFINMLRASRGLPRAPDLRWPLA
jgi:hypothetical protein